MIGLELLSNLVPHYGTDSGNGKVREWEGGKWLMRIQKMLRQSPGRGGLRPPRPWHMVCILTGRPVGADCVRPYERPAMIRPLMAAAIQAAP
jgi:hypothetical protein